MNIIFEEENTTLFAVAYDEIIDDYQFDELLIAEIDPALGGYMVRFESAYSAPVHCGSLDEAKRTVLKDYYKYKPTSVGKNHYIG